MSSAPPRRTRPSPAVYRRRRAVALLLVLLIVAGIAWGVSALLSRGGEEPTAGDAAEGADLLLASRTGTADDDAGGDADGDAAEEGATTPEPGEIVACAARDLSLDVSADPSTPAAGAAVTFRLVVRNEGQVPCLLDAGPANLVVSVTSGSDAVWSSAHCGEDPNELLLDVDAHYTVPVRWNGQRSAAGCAGGQPAVSAGTYRAGVSLGGTSLPSAEPLVLRLG